MELLLAFTVTSVAMGIVANRRQKPAPVILVLVLIVVVATGYLSRRLIL